MLVPNKVTRRVGNWCEESILREEKLREFLAKVESGNLGFKRMERINQLVNTPVVLSSSLLFNENIMIKSEHTNGFLSTNIPENYLQLKLQDSLSVGITPFHFDNETKHSTARLIFKLQRNIDFGSGYDKQPRWGESFYITTQLPGISLPLYLGSKIQTLADFKGSEKQSVYLSFQPDFNSVWKFECVDVEYRMEVEGTVIQPNTVGLMTHVNTGRTLSSNGDRPGMPFESQREVFCHHLVDSGAQISTGLGHWRFFVDSHSSTNHC